MILFYKTKDQYGAFSNFSRHEVAVFKHTWQTSEHAFQAMKFYPHRTDIMLRVQNAPSPRAAADMGRDRAHPIIGLWEGKMWGLPPILTQTIDDSRGPDLAIKNYKDLIMFIVVLAKFGRNDNLKEFILSTDDEPLIEDTDTDSYWGWATNHKGDNRLGKTLMLARKVIQGGLIEETYNTATEYMKLVLDEHQSRQVELMGSLFPDGVKT